MESGSLSEIQPYGEHGVTLLLEQLLGTYSIKLVLT